MLPDKAWMCGHIHGLFKAVKKVLNVGVDVWDFKPVSWEEADLYMQNPESEEMNVQRTLEQRQRNIDASEEK